MKKLLIVLAILMLVVPAMGFHPDTDCTRCHTPHKADMDPVGAGMPLWNGEASTATFTMYDSETMDLTGPGEPIGPDLLCLSCHDGAGHYTVVQAGGDTGDLTGSHPISIDYNAASLNDDSELVDPTLAGSSTVVGGRGTIDEDLLVNGKVSCVSCHDIHVQGLHGEELDFDSDGTVDFNFDIPHMQNLPGIQMKLARRADASVEDNYSLSTRVLCVTCHIK